MNLQNYLNNIIVEFEKMQSLAEKAMVQVTDELFFKLIDSESNSIAIIVKHIAGNQKSRWTDFLASDGEKDFRKRDTEFILKDSDTRESLLNQWESGWKFLYNTLNLLNPEDLDKIIKIRNEDHFVFEAINRQLTHYASHIGEIIILAKHFAGKEWKTLSVAKGQSENFNKQMFNK